MMKQFIFIYKSSFFYAILSAVYICLISVAASCVSIVKDQNQELSDTSYTNNEELTFVATMQHAITPNKNTVYAASLPLAWQVLRKELKVVVPVQSESDDVKLLDQSLLAAEVLDEKDYERKISRSGKQIKVETKQAVDLTFSPAFIDIPNRLLFGDVAVEAFGTIEDQNAAYPYQIEVLSYRDDQSFAIRLQPLEDDHELLLFKADTVFENFEQMYRTLETAIKHGEKEKLQSGKEWRYQLTDDDHVIIPKIGASRKHTYHEFFGTSFQVKNNIFTIDQISQNVIFDLNQYGVRMQSEAEIIINMGAIPVEYEPHPKMLIFDQPFYLMMKKKGKEQPYFILYVCDSSLMIKE